MKDKSERTGIACVLSCYVLWGVLPIFWKQLSGLNALFTLSVRIVWASAFCLLLALLAGQGRVLRSALRDGGERTRLMLAGLALAVNWGLYIYAVNAGRLLESSLAYYLDPIFTILAGRVVYGERLRPAQFVAVAIAALGLIAAAVLYGAVPYLTLAIAVAFAAYGVIKKRCATPAPASTLIEIICLAPIGLVYALLAQSRGAGTTGVLTGAALLLLPASGLLTALPLVCFTAGLSRVPLNVAGILKYINPTLQMLLGVLLYGEKFGLKQALPFACAWIALALYLLAGAKKDKAAA